MSKRIQRVNELLKQEVGQILLRDFECPKGILVTVTRAETSLDLGTSRIFISVIPEGNEDKVMRLLGKKIYVLQQKVNKKLKMKRIPKIEFIKEEKAKEAERIEEILERLKK